MEQSSTTQPYSATSNNTKPFFEYQKLVELLQSRGMGISCETRTRHKLEQIGYYRLSGYWYPARVFENQCRTDRFYENTHFDNVVDLYVFDKQLRLLLSDALERIEIYIRSIIAHEMGRVSPMSYISTTHIRRSYARSGDFTKWRKRLEREIGRSRDDSIVWHKECDKAIPFWVAVEAWNFGLLRFYYKMLKPEYQQQVCDRVGISKVNTLDTWLDGLNILRNRCAHHGRTWNRSTGVTFTPLQNSEYFKALNLSNKSQNRVYGAVAVIFYLLRDINPESCWLKRLSNLIDGMPSVPGCSIQAMGIPDD
ncbi:Abi family protein, partial [Endozoicomonas sp. ONNA1]|uniref:Abi family protein n=1 Tax=Endozoicomonas sp. ONNA1 TaxID=2828740 RepID=UPI0021491115